MSEEIPLFPFFRDPYKVLGISPEASIGEIKQAYFTLVKKYSPEKNPEAFKKIRAAYEQIRSQQRKEETDFLLFEEATSTISFHKTSGSLYHISEDLLDIELWHTVNLHIS